MQCLKPIRLVSDGIKGVHYVPCGRCASCLYNQIQDKIIRITLWDEYSETPLFFVTLTYNEEYLPPDGVNKQHCIDFMKRLRHQTRDKITFTMISEYGSKTKRAHYHYILNGFKNINYLYKALERTWKYGNFKIAPVIYERIQYIAKYHVTRLNAPKNHNKCFSLCSKGIGKEYLNQRNIDYHHRYSEKRKHYNGTLRRNGKSYKLPRYLKERIYSDMDCKVMAYLNEKEYEQQKHNFVNGAKVQQWTERFYKYYGKKTQI